MPEMMKRLFAAIKIEPSEELLMVYYALRDRLKNEKIKWVEPHNLHLTLKFFGETPISEIENINHVLSGISEQINAFKFTINKTGIFGSRYNPRVIWCGFKEEELLRRIGKKVHLVLNESGYPADRQNFVPHFTVGRIKKIDRKDDFQKAINEFKNIQIKQFEVDHFTLFESVLKPTGPQYFPLFTYFFHRMKI